MKTRYAAAGVLAMAMASAQGGEPVRPALDWMAGHWCRSDGDMRIEEVWLPAHDGRLHGVSRMTRGAKVASFEFLRIEPVEGEDTYLAQPGGRPATAFRRTAGGAGWVRFENAQHDFPQRIEYRREDDRLRAGIAGPGRDGGTMVIPFELAVCGR